MQIDQANIPSPASTAQADPSVTLSRRRALARLGLAAGAAYAAPTVLHLDRRAFAASTPCPPPGWTGPRPASCPKR